MTEKENKLTSGTWDRITGDDSDRAPKIDFEINVPVKFVFTEDAPVEKQGQDGGFYYIFRGQVEGQEKVIMTSAITLLIELKKLIPLKGKQTVITKKIDKGKQHFEVAGF